MLGRMRNTGIAILGYGALAAALLACFWVISLAPLRLGWGRELIGAAIAVVALVIGQRLAAQRRGGEHAARRESTAAAAADSPPRPPPVECPELSQREQEVLIQLAEGLSNKEIARVLKVSENTVKTHLANLYAKLGVSRRTEALKVARQRGIA